MVADIEASAHRAGIALLMNDLAFLVLAFLFEALGRGDRQIAVLELKLNLILFESGQIHGQLIAVIVFLEIRLHYAGCVLAVQLVVHIGFQASEREVKPVIKQTLSKNTRQHKSYLL